MLNNIFIIFVCGFLINVSICESVPGGWKKIETSDSSVVNLASFVASKLSTGEHHLSVLNVASAYRQVVSGTNTRLNLDLSENGRHTKTCDVTIWEQPWLNSRKITNVNCTDVELSGKRTSRNIPGRIRDVHVGIFNDFVKEYGKKYSNDKEYKKRFHIFKGNMKKIKYLRDTEQGTAEYGVNEFADLSSNEFKRHYLGVIKPEVEPVLPKAEIPEIDLPTDFDWRKYNAVTPVKNQGQCGSCWAFSVTGNIEGQQAIKNGQLISLSEQEIVDCDKADNGCGGGYMTTAYDSIVKIGGLESETDYPYDAEDETCHFDSSEVKVKITGGVNITSNETGMAMWLVKNGPLSVGLNANAMQFYLRGVSHPYKVFCSPDSIDHGVLIVGYGVQTSKVLKKTLPYWLVKNSWGGRWGELGYYKLYRGDGSCGINKMVTSAVLD